MIAVTGANGQLGQLVIKNLLEKTAATNIVALVRDPQKATALAELGVTVRQADYNQPASLVPALRGVTKLLLISGSEIGKRVPQHQAVIDAARAQGLSLLAYTSLLKADVNPMQLAAEHKATELAIRDAGIPAVILRNGWYTENYTHAVQNNIASGIVMGAAAEGKLHTASRQDYAEAAVAILLAEQPQAGKIYELAGDHGFTLAEFAATVSRLAGKTVHFNNISQAEYTDVLCQSGLPHGLAAIVADCEAQAAKGFLADNSQTLSKLIGRPTTTLEQSLTSIL